MTCAPRAYPFSSSTPILSASISSRSLTCLVACAPLAVMPSWNIWRQKGQETLEVEVRAR
ncbi:MAG: hypothetical protein HY531_03325 [Chloroflexi bacterium]|nr:hypothetical protein [Chloroflexota bacterium]